MHILSGRTGRLAWAGALVFGLAATALAQVAANPVAASANGVVAVGHYLGSIQQQAIKAYYGPMILAGNCPPGIPRTQQGCSAPQQRLWRIGSRLPLGIVSYPVPSALLARMAPLPAGCNVIRVGADILLVASGGIVVDAVENLAF